MLTNKKILIIGGTGSLGQEIIKRYSDTNELYLYSRDESKHWALEIENKKLNFIIGDIADEKKIHQTLLRHNFQIIILAAALKHIDRCEYETNECLKTNFLGTKNVVDCIENNHQLLTNLESVCFISTDKACSPVNFYGIMKAASECLMIEKAKFVSTIKFVCVRYGNVLNSRGSIIPLLHNIGSNDNITEFKLTHEDMTRFVMTLSQSVDLIEHAIEKGESGDVVIPKLVSCKIKDLLEIFSEIYNKPVVLDKLRPGEKMLESLINETQSARIVKSDKGYMYIRPPFKNLPVSPDIQDYNSKLNPFTKFQLKQYLNALGLITLPSHEVFNFTQTFQNIYPFPYLKIDNILDEYFATQIQEEILNISEENWDRYENPFESKYTLRDKSDLPPHCKQLFSLLTSQDMLDNLTHIMKIPIYNDPTKNWWGIHKYDNGDKLDIHVDAGIHPTTKQKKQLTLGIYLSSKEWNDDNGGHLEIWEGENTANNNAKLIRCCEKILPKFNRMVLFDCNDFSWHGNPYPIKCEKGEKRVFVTISYVSDSTESLNKRQKAFFVKHPDEPEDEEKDKIRMMRCDPEKYKEVYNINIHQ